jgi:hypothetical protein
LACSDPPYIDLHIHSNASDGSLTPREILDQASRLGLGAVAITDHDTVSGAEEAFRAGVPAGLALLSGVEISASPPEGCPARGSFHILGYGIDLKNRPLNRTLDTLQRARSDRNPQIVARLRMLGIPISWEAVQERFGTEGQLGRPHIAQMMVQEGWVGSFNEAFERFLGAGKPAYVDKYRIACSQAVTLIREAGGVPVLAHPGLLRIDHRVAFAPLLRDLKAMGIRGIEAHYPEHSPEFTRQCITLAQRHDLLLTGGTDFHGSLKPEVRMGFGRGDFHVPYSLYTSLLRVLKPCAPHP